jgi:NAD(P) transhydrogenase subunit alpha
MTTGSSALVSLRLPRERLPGERRVALTRADVKRPSAKAIVTVETGAGLEAGFPDDADANAGAHLAGLQQVLDGTAVIAKVRAPDASQTPRAGGVLISLGGRDAGLAKRFQERPVSPLAFERVPRMSRAQVMDVLSSQASVTGYVSALEGACLLDILLPILTTAAGIIKP